MRMNNDAKIVGSEYHKDHAYEQADAFLTAPIQSARFLESGNAQLAVIFVTSVVRFFAGR
jgi:hypothetical protein